MYLIKESGTSISSEDVPKISNYLDGDTNGINVASPVTDTVTYNTTIDINGVNHTCV